MISGGYKSTAYKMPARVMASGRVPLRTGGWFNPSGGLGRMSSLPNASELKFKDTSAATVITAGVATFTTPGAAFLLNGLVPDSTATGRIGRRVNIKSLYVRLVWGAGSASTGSAPLRVLIVYDKQANATAPAVTDVVVTDAFTSMNNISNRDRFVTLCDKIVEPCGVGVSLAVSEMFYKKLNLPVQFNAGTAGTIGDITSGSIYIMFAQSGNIATSNAACTWYSRIRYTDN